MLKTFVILAVFAILAVANISNVIRHRKERKEAREESRRIRSQGAKKIAPMKDVKQQPTLASFEDGGTEE